MIEDYLLNIKLAQINDAWSKSKDNKYSDRRRIEYSSCLGQLFEKLIHEDFKALSDAERESCKIMMEFFSDSLSLLSCNTKSIIPHEMIECLNLAANDWINDFEGYIIVMIDGPYAIKTQADNVDTTYEIIKNRYGIEFKYKLLEVHMPKHLNRDYLTNIALYHELGHFVDSKHRITEVILTHLLKEWIKGAEEQSKIKYFFRSDEEPFYVDGAFLCPTSSTYYYIKEYFADVFAAQYVEDKLCCYLSYLDSSRLDKCGPSHPSFNQRKDMVSDFLKVNSNILLDLILKETKDVSTRELKKKYVDLDSSDLLNLIPMELKNNDELHSIFRLGWILFQEGSSNIEKSNNMGFSLSASKYYRLLNNLIEKTIGNYLIVRSWTDSKKK